MVSILGEPSTDGGAHHQHRSDARVRRKWRGRVGIGAVILAIFVIGILIGNGVGNEDARENATPVVANPATPMARSLLDASGYVVAARQATVSSETTGRLIEVLVDEGTVVHAGQVLARLDPRDIDQQIRLAEAQLKSVRDGSVQHEVELEAAGDRLRRMHGLVAQRFVSDDAYKAQEYEVRRLQTVRTSAVSDIAVAQRQLSVQRQRLQNMDIVAPFDGMVTERAAQVGEIVSPISAGGGFTRTGICTLVDIASTQVRARVNEKHVGRVHEGQSVTLVPRAYPDLHLRGRVSRIMPVAERETASVEVIVDFVKRDPRILPNMSIDVSFAADDAPDSDVPLAVTEKLNQ